MFLKGTVGYAGEDLVSLGTGCDINRDGISEWIHLHWTVIER